MKIFGGPQMLRRFQWITFIKVTSDILYMCVLSFAEKEISTIEAFDLERYGWNVKKVKAVLHSAQFEGVRFPVAALRHL